MMYSEIESYLKFGRRKVGKQELPEIFKLNIHGEVFNLMYLYDEHYVKYRSVKDIEVHGFINSSKEIQLFETVILRRNDSIDIRYINER